MSQAATALSRATNRAYALFGEAAHFSARDEAARACTVLLDHSVAQYGDTAQVTAKTVVVALRTSEVPDLPRKGDVIDITAGQFAGRSLVVASVVSSDEYEHKVLAA